MNEEELTKFVLELRNEMINGDAKLKADLHKLNDHFNGLTSRILQDKQDRDLLRREIAQNRNTMFDMKKIIETKLRTIFTELIAEAKKRYMTQ